MNSGIVKFTPEDKELIANGIDGFFELTECTRRAIIDYLLSLSATASEPKPSSFVRSREVHNIS